MKNTLVKVLIIVGLVIVSYVVFQVYNAYSEAQQVREEAAVLITEYEELKAIETKYIEQTQLLESERVRCADYVRQDSGDFSEFEYCKRFLELTVPQ